MASRAGWTLDDSVVLAKELFARGVDVLDCTSGGTIADRSSDARVRRGFAFHAPYSRELKARTGGMVATVGLIIGPHQAEAVLQSGDADIVAIGREMLVEPSWPNRAREALLGEDYTGRHCEAGWNGARQHYAPCGRQVKRC